MAGGAAAGHSAPDDISKPASAIQITETHEVTRVFQREATSTRRLALTVKMKTPPGIAAQAEGSTLDAGKSLRVGV